MLVAKNVKKKYSSFAVVDDVSFSVGKGEIVSIIGPSGAGKSTLLHLIGALDKPDSGEITINGVNVAKLNSLKQAKFRNQHLGFVFQFHHLLPEFSSVENVAMPLWISGMDKKTAITKAALMLDIVGLGGRIDHKPSELSGGEQQRVAIARALVNEPTVIMADEPTGNLDSNNANAIHELFLNLRERLNQTFIMITHNEELARLTDRTLLMKDGKIVEERVNRL